MSDGPTFTSRRYAPQGDDGEVRGEIVGVTDTVCRNVKIVVAVLASSPEEAKELAARKLAASLSGACVNVAAAIAKESGGDLRAVPVQSHSRASAT